MSNLVVQTNVLALNAHRNIKVIGQKQELASQRLSSGYRINTAADDASGLAISEKMRAQIRGLDMASKNTDDGKSLITTAEGGLSQIDDMVQRIRELTVQAANDTNDYASSDRKKIQDEIDQLTAGIDQMAGQVEFNKKKLLDGSYTDDQTKASLLGDIDRRIVALTGQSVASVASNYGGYIYGGNATKQTLSKAAATLVLASAGKAYSYKDGSVTSLTGDVKTGNIAAAVLEATTTVATVAGGKVLTAAISAVTVAGIKITGYSAIGAASLSSAAAFDKWRGDVQSTISQLQAAKAAGSTSVDAALRTASAALEAGNKVYAAVQQVAAAAISYQSLNSLNGSGMWFQTGANSAQGLDVGIGSVKSNVLGIGDGEGNSLINVNQEGGLHVDALIDSIDDALQYVTSQRAKLGAISNRLDYTKKSLDVSSENLSAAESRIRDTDMAKEMMNYTKANVLNQAGISMLAQANQAPQNILSLLR